MIQKKTRFHKVMTLILAVLMFAGIMSVGFTASAADSAQIKALPDYGYGYGIWLSTDTAGGGALAANSSGMSKTLNAGETGYFIFSSSQTTWSRNGMNAAIVTLDANGVPSVKDAKVVSDKITQQSTSNATITLEADGAYRLVWGSYTLIANRPEPISTTVQFKISGDFEAGKWLETLPSAAGAFRDAHNESPKTIYSRDTTDKSKKTYYYCVGKSTWSGFPEYAIIVDLSDSGVLTVNTAKISSTGTLGAYDSPSQAEITEYNGINYLTWGPLFNSGDTGPKKDTIRLSVIAKGELNHMGFAESTDLAAKNLTTPNVMAVLGTQTLQAGKSYVVYIIKQTNYLGGYGDCVLLEVSFNGSVTATGITWDTNNKVIAKKAVNNYRLSAGYGGVVLEYAANSESVQTVFTSDMLPDAKYGTGVVDGQIQGWADFQINNPLKATGGNRQAFSINYVSDLLDGLADSKRPARSVVPNYDGGGQEYLDDLTGWYKISKENNADYMWHPDTDYPYSDYYMHDVYLQGVWDSMPAYYGWKQDSYTTPGKIQVEEHKAVGSDVTGMIYGVQGGGQNPWVVCDYLERNGSRYDEATGKIIDGTGTAKGWFYGYDEEAETPYLWNPENGLFMTYENERSLIARCEYVNDENIAGLIVWELSGDNTANYPMLTTMKENLNPGKNIMGYFTNWSIYNPYHQTQKPSDLPLDILTHVNYSFFEIGGHYEDGNVAPQYTVSSMDRWADGYGGYNGLPKNDPNTGANSGYKMIAEFADLKKEYTEFKLLFSIGGWTRGNGFNEMVSSAASRATFIASVKSFMTSYPQFDGIDLDWEYPTINRVPDFEDPADLGCPGSPSNYNDYTALCKELREMLDRDFPTRNILTACAPAAPSNIEGNQDILKISEYCTFVNMMTYDYHGAFDPVIGYNSGLYSNAENPDDLCTEVTVDYLKSIGADLTKFNIGTPFYSRGWAGVLGEDSIVTADDGTVLKNPAPLYDPTPIFPAAEPVPATGFDTEDVTMEVNSSKTIKITTQPSGSKKGAMTYKSNDESLVTVDANGKITSAEKEGSTTITVTMSTESGTVTKTVTVKVVDSRQNAAVFKVDSDLAYNTRYGVAQTTPTIMLPIESMNTNKAFLPFREGAKAAGALDVNYNDTEKSVTLVFEDFQAKFVIDSTTVTFSDINGNNPVTDTIPAEEVPILRDYTVDGEIVSKAYLPARILSFVPEWNADASDDIFIDYVNDDDSGKRGEFVIYTKKADYSNDINKAKADYDKLIADSIAACTAFLATN